MKLDAKLVRDFARATNDSKKSRDGVTAYGEMKSSPDGLCVQLDGSDQLTPVVEAMDAEPGDRVMVMIKNHTATVIGNISSPASARTATKFMRLTDSGLIVGNLDSDGEPAGYYALIDPGTLTRLGGYYVMNAGGNSIASFTGDGVSIGTDVKTKIVLNTTDGLRLGQAVRIDTDGDAYFTGSGSFNKGFDVSIPIDQTEAFGMHISGTTLNDARLWIGVNGDDATVHSYISLNQIQGVNIKAANSQVHINGKTGVIISSANAYVDLEGYVRINTKDAVHTGYEIVKKTSYSSGSSSVTANSYHEFEISLVIPTGWSFVGISSIWLSSTSCVVCGYHIVNGSLVIRVRNISADAATCSVSAEVLLFLTGMMDT